MVDRDFESDGSVTDFSRRPVMITSSLFLCYMTHNTASLVASRTPRSRSHDDVAFQPMMISHLFVPQCSYLAPPQIMENNDPIRRIDPKRGGVFNPAERT